jgi:hypothetical protein
MGDADAIATDADGHSALHYAQQNKRPQLAALLRANGATD